jgi:hypothetical protein
VCPKCLHQPHEEEEDGICPVCAAEGDDLPARSKCFEFCALPNCGHRGKRSLHSKNGCPQCEPGAGCNATAAANRAAEAARAASSVPVQAEAGDDAAGEQGEEVDYGQLEDEAETEGLGGLLESLARPGGLLGGSEAGNRYVDLVASAEGSPELEDAEVALELAYLEEDQVTRAGAGGSARTSARADAGVHGAATEASDSAMDLDASG